MIIIIIIIILVRRSEKNRQAAEGKNYSEQTELEHKESNEG